MPDQRDLILIPVPFSDLTSNKRRPVVVISNDNYNSSNSDIVVVAVTSNVKKRSFAIPLEQSDLESGYLKAPSMIRADKIYTLNKSISVRTVGKVKVSVLGEIKDSILELMRKEK
ncbi:MAG: type II toxin-antitoxin system PemK/MazF family toxin [Planctomycetes bacterium]|nr:type II toxin-antitoxin system PemK/MazF family toxin [Planctomycetota bacterium]